MSSPYPLCCLPLHTSAVIVALSPDCPNRRRLMDFGFVCGATVCPLFRSPTGNPTAYQIGETVVALRKADIVGVFVRPTPPERRCPP